MTEVRLVDTANTTMLKLSIEEHEFPFFAAEGYFGYKGFTIEKMLLEMSSTCSL